MFFFTSINDTMVLQLYDGVERCGLRVELIVVTMMTVVVGGDDDDDDDDDDDIDFGKYNAGPGGA